MHPHPQWELVIWVLNALNYCHHYGLDAKLQLIGLEEDLPGNHTYRKENSIQKLACL